MDDDTFDIDETSEGSEPSSGPIEHTPMPTIKQNPCVSEHNSATRVDEAHPIDEHFKDDIDGSVSMVIDFSLAALQAVADVTEIDGQIVEETEDLIYYKVTSGEFYRLLGIVAENYDVNTPVEEARPIVELHTKQLLSDIHDYEGDFDEGDITLCNAMNDPTPYDGKITDDKLPEGIRYGYIDSRGFVVQKDSHSESNS